MKNLLLIVTILIAFCCKNSIESKKEQVVNQIKKDTVLNYKKAKIDSLFKDGFLFVNIKKIYFSGKKISLLDENNDTLMFFKEKFFFSNKKKYEIIEDEMLYSNQLKIRSFDPEYGLFIMRCVGFKDGFYEVLINNNSVFINKENHKDILVFKDEETYVFESYPVPTKENPLRIKPDENSETINDYLNYTFLSVKIEGDWLMVKDDKNCFIEEPAKENIIGWIRWRKDGKIIIRLAQTC